VHLFDQRGFVRQTAGIEFAHLFDQRLQFLLRLGSILHRGANLVESVQPLLNLALRIGGIGALLRSHGLTLGARVAEAQSAIAGAVAVAPASGRIADLATLSWLLSGLAALTWLPVTRQLAGLLSLPGL
jgi:hypothetical protein